MLSRKLKFIAAAGLVMSLSVLLPACAVIGGIFKLGAAVGVIVVLIALAIIFWIMRMFRR